MTLRRIALSITAAVLLGSAAHAEIIAVDEGVALRDSSVDRPGRGMTMTRVEEKFGTPASRHAAVGQPPITRWDYPGFSVFFEHQHVVHAVATRA